MSYPVMFSVRSESSTTTHTQWKHSSVCINHNKWSAENGSSYGFTYSLVHTHTHTPRVNTHSITARIILSYANACTGSQSEVLKHTKCNLIKAEQMIILPAGGDVSALLSHWHFLHFINVSWRRGVIVLLMEIFTGSIRASSSSQTHKHWSTGAWRVIWQTDHWSEVFVFA